MNYCIYGAASDKIDSKYKDVVTDLCYELGKKGHTLVFGAGSTGVMGAAARGATKAQSEIIGISPSFMKQFEPMYDKCTTLLVTENMAERKLKLEGYSDLFVVCPGGIGTFDEFFQIITLRKLKRHNKEIILFNFEGFYDDLVAYMDKCAELGFISKDIRSAFMLINTKEEIIEYFDNFVMEDK